MNFLSFTQFMQVEGNTPPRTGVTAGGNKGPGQNQNNTPVHKLSVVKRVAIDNLCESILFGIVSKQHIKVFKTSF